MQTNSPALQQSECVGTELDYNFIFEDLSQGLNSRHKIITANKPIQVFRSFKALDSFLEKNPDLLELENAGFAGYLGYEGNCELAVYEKIKTTENKSVITSNTKTIDTKQSKSFKIVKPDPSLYLKAVKKCQEYIKEGEIYQANIAHKFKVINENCQTIGFGESFYKKLKNFNPAPYAGYMNFEDYEIISSSPESFIKIVRNSEPKDKGTWTISSSPIKGTAKLNELNELLESSKERAEHIMIVDLIRNDLGKICKAGSINIKELMGIHKFKNLYHYISTVEGILCDSELKPKNQYHQNEVLSCLQEGRRYEIPKFSKIFDATFPGGSITGTPKKRSMEIISELESFPRELFTGTMGYFRFQDGGEFNILIRSVIYNKITQELSFHTGSGITAYSDPQRELEETYLKAEKILEAFGVKL